MKLLKLPTEEPSDNRAPMGEEEREGIGNVGDTSPMTALPPCPN